MKLFNLMSAMVLLSLSANATAAPAARSNAGGVIPGVSDLNTRVVNLTTPQVTPVTLTDSRLSQRMSSANYSVAYGSGFGILPGVGRKAPAKAPAVSLPMVMKGSLIYDSNWGDASRWGMYSIAPSGGDFSLLTSESVFTNLDYVANGGGCPFGEDSYFIIGASIRYESDNSYVVEKVRAAVFNSETWELERYEDQSLYNAEGKQIGNYTYLADAISYDPVTERIYGSFQMDEASTTYAFRQINPSDFQITTCFEIDEPFASCCFDKNGQLYVLYTDGRFCKFDKTTGKTELISETQIPISYFSSGAINPDDNRYYYIATWDKYLGHGNTEQASAMYAIDIETGATEKVFDFDRAVQFVGAYFSAPSMTELTPAAPTDFVCDFNNTSFADVTFVAPSTTRAGEPITDEMEWTLTLNKEVFKSGTVMPGETVTVPGVTADNGYYTVAVYCSNEYGDGKAASIYTYIGEMPGYALAPSNVSFVEDKENWGKMYLSWDDPTEDEYGQPLDNVDYAYRIFNKNLTRIATEYKNNSLVYDLKQYYPTNNFEKKQVFEQLTLWTGTKVDEYGYDFPINSKTYTDTELVSVGKPYSLPFQDAITIDGPAYNWVRVNGEDVGSFYFFDEFVTSALQIYPYDNDGGFILWEPYWSGQRPYVGELLGGKIDLGTAQSPSLFFQLYRRDNATVGDAVGVFIFEEGDLKNELTHKIVSITPTEGETGFETGWYTVEVPLDECKGKVILPRFLFFSNYSSGYIAIDNIEVRNCSDNDLGLNQFSYPQSVVPGRQTSFSAVLRNWGKIDVSGAVVNLVCDGEVVATKTIDVLGAGVSERVTFSYTPSSLLPDKSEFYMEVVHKADAELENNKTPSIDIDVVHYTHPSPETLAGEIMDGDLVLYWGEPVFIPVETVTESFELYDPFTIGNFGEWLNVDLDNHFVYTVGDASYPHAGEPQGWQIFTHSDYAAKTGDYALAAFAGEDGGAANMLPYDYNIIISPKLSGNAQTVEFWARALDSKRNGDWLEVFYSKNTNDEDDFLQENNAAIFTDLSGLWTKYTFNLPADAMYFFISHCQMDDEGLGVLIDDVTYEQYGNDNLTLTGYNIYCNGVRLNDVPVEETSYVIKDADKVSGNFVVTALYKEGESAPSNVFGHNASLEEVGVSEADAVTVSAAGGVISVKGATGIITVADAQGRVIATENGAAVVRFNVSAGFYIVSADGKAFKVVVD